MGDPGPGRRRTAIVVSGMHRSGTSAITRVVSLLGAMLPPDLIEGRRDNERGFWESRAVVDLDSAVLERLGSWWGGWEAVEPQRLLRQHRVAEQARGLLREQFGAADLVLVKDPRISRLLPLWTRVLQDEGFACVHIIAVRHPDAVARSLQRRNGLDVRASALSWLAHSLDAEKGSRGQTRAFVSFEGFVRDWRSEADRLATRLDVEWKHSPGEVAADVDEFIDLDLVHESPAAESRRPIALIEPVYDVLRRWSTDDPRPGDEATLQWWRERLRPVRAVPSPVATIAAGRKRALRKARAGQQAAGLVAATKAWSLIEHDGHNTEASVAWAWLMRERAHARDSERADRQAEALRQPLAGQRQGAAGKTPKRSDATRRPLPQAGRQAISRLRRRGQ